LQTLSLAKRIIALRKLLKLSQTELGERVGASPMAVSRWERGQIEPSSRMLLRLGVLSNHDSEMCWKFWNEAGLHANDVISVLPVAATRLRPTLPILRFVPARLEEKLRDEFIGESLVAIPFLQIMAAAGKGPGSSAHDLTHARFDQVIAAPKLWCPNPRSTVCMRVKGNSMEPVPYDGYIIIVDQAQNQRSKLNKQIVVVRHDKFGLVVSRFWQLKKVPTLLSDNREHDPVPMSAAWTIVGKVLWWIGEASS
jgi:transcriptional regulator with XRE-family HTH domain